MRIITLSKKILCSFLFLVLSALSYGQCPTAVSPQTFCDIQFFPNAPRVANLIATNNGGGVAWFSSPISTVPLLSTQGLVSGQTYYADNAAGNCGTRQAVLVTVFGRPDAQSFQGPCVDVASAATVSQLQAVGNNVQWYLTPSGGTPLSPTAVLIDNGFYYCSQTNPFTGCETSRRAVQANVGLVPVPSGNSIQTFCNLPGSPPILSDVVASGNNNWYATDTSVIPLSLETVLVDGQSYFGTTVDLPCESTSRFEVQVQLIEPANPGISGVKRICVNELANFPEFSLFGELSGTADATGTWSGPLTTSGGSLGTVDLSALTLAGSPYTFTYTVSTTPCPGASSTVTIIVEPLPTVTISTTNTNVCFGGNGTVNFTGTPGATVTYSTGSGPNQVVTLNGSGTFSLDTGSLTLDTTYSLISVSSGGVPSCTNAAIGSVTFAVVALPVASISTTTPSVCAGSATTINFNGTPNAIVTYTINGVANQIGIDALGIASLVTLPLAVDTIITLTSVTSSFPISCANILTESITITALPLPTASLSSSLPSICSGTASTVTFTGTPFAIITYKIDSNPNQTISLDSSGQANIDTAVLTIPTTYTLVGVAYSGVPGCSQPLTGSLTIGILPLPTASISSPTLSICSESTATINFTGTPNATVTYNVDASSNQTITLNGAGTASIVTPVLTSNSVYTLVSVSSAGSPICVQPLATSITIVVNPLPTASISSSNLNICAGSTAAIAFNGTPNAIITYTINSVSSQISLNALGTATVTTLPLSANATISLISITLSGSPSCSKTLSESITINAESLPNATISSTQLQTCFGTSATVVFSGTPNATVNFTVDGVANQIVLDNSGNASFATSILTVPSIYALISVTSGSLLSCTRLLSESITIAILPLPVAAISSTTLNICNGTSGTIDFSGTPFAVVTYSVDGVIQTIPLDASGSASIITPSLSSNSIYSLISVSSTNNPICTTLLSDSITIQVDPIPNLIVGAGSTICSGENASILLTGTPNTVVTYNLGGGTNLTIPLDASGTATISNSYTTTTVVNFVSISTQGTPGCDVPLTNTVTIQVSPLPTATISSPTLSICSESTATINFTGTPNATVTYNVDASSNQTITLNGAGTASIVTPVLTSNSVYTLVSVSSAGSPICVQPLATSITIVVNPLPTASISSSNLNICAGSTAAIAFNGTPNAIITYTINSVSSQISLNALGTATVTTLPLSANATISLISITLSGSPSCSKTLSESITINAESLPNATISSTQLQTCFGTSATVVFSGTPNATVNFTVDGVANQIVLDNSGNASFATSILTVPSIYALISVTSGSLLSCTRLLSESITIAILPLPVAAISSTTLNICNGTSGTIDFSGTPFAVVTYSVDGVIQTIPLDASGSASIITPSLSSNSIYSLISVSSTNNPICTTLLSDSITIQVDPIPNLIVGAGSTICSGENASILLTGTPNTVVTYNLGGGTNLTIPLDASGTATISNSYTTTTVVNFVSISTQGTPGCNVSLTNTVTIQVLPLPTATISSPTLSICSESTATINFTGTPFATVTYTVNNVSNTILLDASGSATLQSNISVETNYTLVSVVAEGLLSCTNPLSESLTIDIVNLPIATISSSGIFCAGSFASILFTGTPNSVVTYNVNGESTSTVNIGPSGIFTLSLPLLETSTFNLVSIILDGSPSCSQLLTGSTTITVTEPPEAGSNAALAICSNGATQNLFELLGANAQPGGTWSPVLASGTGIFDPTIDPAGDYIYTVAGTPPCANDTALVTITLIPAANAGTDGNANLCSNADPVDLLTFLGGSPQAGGTWTPSLISGTGIFNPGIDLAGVYTYTVNGDAPCANDSSTVTISITPGPNAGTSGNTTLCVNSPAQDLFLSLGGSPQVGGTWSPALASGTGVFDPAIDTQGVYTYTFSGNQICDDDTATVTVIVNPLPYAGEDSNAAICSNIAPVDLITYLAGTPQAGGTWTPTLASGTGLFDPAVDVAGIYTYTVGAPFCVPDIALLTVSIFQGPDAGTSGSATFCITNTPQDLFLSLGGSPQTGGVWTPALVSGTGIFDPAIDPAGVYTYIVSGNQPCGFDTATVTVTIDQLPNAGNFVGNQDVCTSQGTFDLFSVLTGFQTGGLWTNTAGQTVSNTIDVSSLAPNTYSYTYTVTNSCVPDDSETVQFTILPNPILDPSNIVVSLPNCSGESVVVSFSNMIDGDYVLNYNLTLANVLLNQNGNVSILSGVGTLSIDASLIPAIGTTRITFLNITNGNTTCTTAINPNVSADFIIQPSSNLEDINLSIQNICVGNDALVTITNANGLTNGDYQFVYSIPGATVEVNTTALIPIENGQGQFTIENTTLAEAGNFTLTITSIVSLSGNCNNLSEDAKANFEVYELPLLSSAILSAGNVCINLENEVTITNMMNRSVEGTYLITYQLSGSSNATNTATITIVGDIGTFIIPATNLTTAGNVTVTITQIQSITGGCDAAAILIDPITFEVTQVDTPILLPEGNEFCISDNPTISNLSTSISGTQPVIWYNALEGGTAYVDNDLLVDVTTYFAAVVSDAGCESTTRLPVTVDLTKCDDILIPDGFSPNGDNVNDEFVIKDIEIDYPRFTIEIYNRYGSILYKGNINTPNWNGTTTVGGMKFGNNVVPVGVYFYILEFNDGIREPKQGRLYLSR
jgi:gliding motility-associated-like protein